MFPKLLLLPAAVLVAGAALAQKPTTDIIKNTFEDGDGGWITLGSDGKIAVTGESAHVKEGKAALRYDYPVAKGKVSFLARGVPDGGLAGMKSIRLWMKADYAAKIMLSVQEKEGGRYNAAFSLPAEEWQRVELTPADFYLSDGPDDPKDPNDRLDLDKVEGIGIADISQIFIQADSDLVQKILGVKPGPHVLYLDEFLVSEEPLPGPPAPEEPLRLDSFRHPQTSWIGVFGARVSNVDSKPLGGRGLQAAYRQQPDAYPGVFRAVRRGSLAGATKLAFDAASVRPAELLIQVEEVRGGKYNTHLSLEGGSTAKPLEVLFADMKAADDSKDTNNKLDLDQVKQLFVADIAGALNQVDQENTLWLGNFRAVK